MTFSGITFNEFCSTRDFEYRLFKCPILSFCFLASFEHNENLGYRLDVFVNMKMPIAVFFMKT